MKKRKNILIVLTGICLALFTAAVPSELFAQQGKVISSYGPTDQTVTFDQIKAARMAVKSELAKQHNEGFL